MKELSKEAGVSRVRRSSAQDLQVLVLQRSVVRAALDRVASEHANSRIGKIRLGDYGRGDAVDVAALRAVCEREGQPKSSAKRDRSQLTARAERC